MTRKFADGTPMNGIDESVMDELERIARTAKPTMSTGEFDERGRAMTITLPRGRDIVTGEGFTLESYGQKYHFEFTRSFGITSQTNPDAHLIRVRKDDDATIVALRVANAINLAGLSAVADYNTVRLLIQTIGVQENVADVRFTLR